MHAHVRIFTKLEDEILKSALFFREKGNNSLYMNNVWKTNNCRDIAGLYYGTFNVVVLLTFILFTNIVLYVLNKNDKFYLAATQSD